MQYMKYLTFYGHQHTIYVESNGLIRLNAIENKKNIVLKAFII